jgi:hypothetical protein
VDQITLLRLSVTTTAIDASPEQGKQKETSSGRAKTDLERLELMKTDLSEKINKAAEETKIAIAKVDQDANQIAKKVSDQANAIINYHRSTSRKIVETINGEEVRVRETVHSLVGSFLLYFWIVALLLLAVGIAAGYSISKFSTVYFVVFSVVWAGASLSALFVLHRKISELLSRSDGLAQLKDMQGEMTEVISSLPQPQPDVSAIHNSTKLLGNTIAELTTASSAVLHNQELTDDLRRKDQFIKDFSFALNRYGFQAFEREMQESFRKQLSSLYDSNSWLEALLGSSKQFFPSTPTSILRLAYFESLGEKTEVDQNWEVVSKAPSLRILLATLLVRNKLVAAPNVSENSVPVLSELLAGVTSYSLDAVRVEAAQFFERLAAFKGECVNRLSLFDLNIVQGIVQLTSFMPRSPSHEKWQNEVVSYIANNLLQVNEAYVELLLREAIGDTSKTIYWKAIIKSKNLPGLAAILARKKLQNKNSEFSSTVYQRHIVLVMENADDFSLPEVEANLRSLEETIVTIGRNVQRASQLYKLQLNDLAYIYNFVPTKMGAIERELLSISAERAQLKQNVFNLFYFSSIGSDRANEFFKNVLGSDIESKILSDFLISREMISKSPFNQQIVPLLRTQQSFDLTNFLFYYARCEKLWAASERLLSFMQEKKVCEKSRQLDFHDIVKSCQRGTTSFEDQIVSNAAYLFTDCVGDHELTRIQKDELAMMTATLFLLGMGEQSYKQLCQRLPFKQLASRALYRYICQADKAILSSVGAKLDTAIVEALELGSDETHFEYFKARLGGGFLPTRASILLAQKSHDLGLEIRKFMKGLGAGALENYLGQINRALYNVVDDEIVGNILSNQIMSAYTMTLPENHPARVLIDTKNNFMVESAKGLSARKADGYQGLLKLSTDESAIVGLVPIGLPFETFAKKFDEIFRGAISLRNAKSNGGPIPYPVPYHLTRIFPFDNALKESSSPQEALKGAIRKLVCSSLSAEEGLLLLTLLQPVADAKVALRNVIGSLVDSSNLKTLVKDLETTVVGQSKEIVSKFDQRVIDEELLRAYNVTRVSHLCKVIAEHVQKLGKDRTKRKFFATMKVALPEISQLSSRKKEALLGTMFRRASSIGLVFSE